MTTRFGGAPVCADDNAPLSGDANTITPGLFPQIAQVNGNDIEQIRNGLNQVIRTLNGLLGVGGSAKKNTVAHTVQKTRTYQVNSDGTINKDNFVDTYRTLIYKETAPSKQVLTNINNTNTFKRLDGKNVVVLEQFTLPQ